MKIMILGSDGYLGWPMTIDLALKKYNLTLVDNFLKRKLMTRHSRSPLCKTKKIDVKVKKLNNYNKNIKFYNIDCTNYEKFSRIFKKTKPDAVIHFAELPSAPLSMLNNEEGWNTLQNNLHSTFNLISCVNKYNKNCHIIKLGTMGEYGTPNIDIEEGWLDITHKKRRGKFLYPRQASSLYHTSKIMDTDLLWFYVRVNNLRVTDLMQGPVYGLLSDKFTIENNFESIFTYDDIFGTVLNRFIVQGVMGLPLSIYGSGNQIRGYINIEDSLKCINLAIKNPPSPGNLNIYNQFTEQFSVKELAKRVIKALDLIGINATSKKINNPRHEKEKHYYKAMNSKMKKLGFKPTLLSNKIIIDIAKHVIKNKKNIKKSIIHPKVKWK